MVPDTPSLVLKRGTRPELARAYVEGALRVYAGTRARSHYGMSGTNVAYDASTLSGYWRSV
eukprot:1296729-Rhodomonas_salina.1